MIVNKLRKVALYACDNQKENIDKFAKLINQYFVNPKDYNQIMLTED